LDVQPIDYSKCLPEVILRRLILPSLLPISQDARTKAVVPNAAKLGRRFVHQKIPPKNFCEKSPDSDLCKSHRTAAYGGLASR
jgi:hypothetical protein